VAIQLNFYLALNCRQILKAYHVGYIRVKYTCISWFDGRHTFVIRCNWPWLIAEIVQLVVVGSETSRSQAYHSRFRAVDDVYSSAVSKFL